jgi:hypothetical protein
MYEIDIGAGPAISRGVDSKTEYENAEVVAARNAICVNIEFRMLVDQHNAKFVHMKSAEFPTPLKNRI